MLFLRAGTQIHHARESISNESMVALREFSPSQAYITFLIEEIRGAHAHTNWKGASNLCFESFFNLNCHFQIVTRTGCTPQLEAALGRGDKCDG